MKLNKLVIAATALLFVSGAVGCGAASETEDLIGSPDTTVDTVGDVSVQDNGRPDVVTPDIETPDVTDVAPEDIPVGDIPVQDVPVLDVPIADIPGQDVPVLDIPVEDVPVADVPFQDIPEDDVLCLNDDGSLCCDGFADCTGRLLGEGEDPCHPAICVGGACVVSSGVVCTAMDVCHLVGTCNPATGQCDNPKAIDGALCPDGTCQDGICTNLCIDVVCDAIDECHPAGTCDQTTGICSEPVAEDGTSCTEGACQDGVCTNMCPFPCIVLIDACVDTLPCNIHTGECATVPSEDGTACAWDGTCVDGNCIAIQDGLFQNNGYWTTANVASVNTASTGNGNAGSGLIEAGIAGSISQTIESIPDTVRLKAGFDVTARCTSEDFMDCMMGGMPPRPALFTGATIAVQGYAQEDFWRSNSSCLGEAAFGTDIVFKLAESVAGEQFWFLEFDNVWLDVVDEETCPAVGTFLNGDMQGTFGWEPCSATTGSISYALDGSTPYVQISGIGAQNDITCMTGWFSAPLATTMSNQALKFEYRAGGQSYGYDFIAQTPAGEMQYLDYNTSSWKEVIRCIPANLAGRAEIFQFSRGARYNGDSDFIAIKDARIESDAIACP